MRIVFLSSSVVLSIGCSLVTNFPQYHGRDGATPSDGGSTDGGANACDPECDLGENCVDRQCMCGASPSCGGRQLCCEDDCVLGDTIQNCGECGDVCEGAENATPRCTDGDCGLDCVPTFADCNEQANDGCEARLLDPDTCGDCNTDCPAGQLCAASGGPPQCVTDCPEGQTQCDKSCIDTSSDPLHCGDCGDACILQANETRQCADSECVFSCLPGYGSCDSDPRGCESELELFYIDADEDGVGSDATTMEGCPGAPPPDFVSTSGDCDDGDPSRFPGNTETCNGADDDCDGTNDDNAVGTGMPCSCMATAAPGISVCDIAAPGGIGCDYPAEVCNGADDDCDGTFDNGFDCSPGATSPCTTMIGTCTARGIATCDPSCRITACTPTETCDRSDDDCDAFVDEDVLTSYPEVEVTTAPIIGFYPRSDWASGLREIGVVYGVEDGSGFFDLYFRRIGVDGVPIGGEIRVESRARDWDVAFDGNHWTIAATIADVTELNDVYTYRVDSATSELLRGATLARSAGSLGASEVRVDRISGAAQVAVVWVEPPGRTLGMNAYARGARISAGVDAATSTVLETVTLNSSGGNRIFGSPAVVNSPTGAFVAYSHWRDDGTTAEIQFYLSVTMTGFGMRRVAATDLDVEEAIEVAHDGRTDMYAIAYRSRPSSGLGAPTFSLLTITPAAVVGTPVGVDAAGDESPIFVDDAGEGNLGVLFTDATSTAVLQRYRGSDLRRVPSALMLGSATEYLQGIPAGAGRYVAFGYGRALVAAPVDCR